MIEGTFETTVEVKGREIDVVVAYTFSPGRPAPPCSNPSSPAYSDPGDPEDVEVYEVRDYDGVDIIQQLDDDQLLDLDDKAMEVGSEELKDRQEEADECKAEFLRGER